jgi:hypothetical protein
MKVKELIEALAIFDEELDVKLYQVDWTYNTNIDKIYYDVTAHGNKEVVLETFDDAR